MRTMQEYLIEKGLLNGIKDLHKPATPKKRSVQKLTDREWAEIIGSNRDTFKRARVELFVAIDRRDEDDYMG